MVDIFASWPTKYDKNVPNTARPSLVSSLLSPLTGGGDREAGGREKRGWEVYERREKKGREAGFPRWREAGEKGKKNS